MLKFEISGGDSGYNEEEAIQPYDNAEDADQTVFRRPPENLRYRTEQLRKAVDNLQMTSASDRALFLLTDTTTTIAWGGAKDVSAGTGIPTMAGGTGIAIMPLLSNAIRVDSGGSPSPDNTPIWAKLAKLNDTATISFTSNKYLYENATNIAIRCYDYGAAVTGGAIVEGVEGTLDSGNPSGLVTIVVRLSNTTGSAIDATQLQVVNAINGHGTASTLVTAATTDGARLAPEIDPGERLRGGVDSEMHSLLQSDWNTFFSFGGNELNEGDCVVFKHADAQARLSQDATDYTPSGWSRLMIIRKDHSGNNNPTNEFNTDVVPICKVTNDAICFINGTGIQRGETINLLPDRTLRADLAKDTPTSGDTLVGAATQTDVGSQTGSVPLSLPATSTVRDHLKRLLGDLNRHIAAPASDDYKHSYHELLNMHATVVDPAGFGDYTTIQAALNALPASPNNRAIIYIKDGTYDASGAPTIDMSGMTLPGEIIFVGESRGGVVITNTDNQRLFNTGTSATFVPIKFENITFEAVTTATAGLYLSSPSDAKGHPTRFINCSFRKTVGTSAMFDSYGDTEFLDCYMYGTDHEDNIKFMKVFEGASAPPRVVVQRCSFLEWGRLFDTDTGVTIKEFIFRDNHIMDTGYAQTGNTQNLLFNLLEVEQLDISNNHWFADGTPGTQNGGRFLKCTDVSGQGLVSNNSLMLWIRDHLSSGQACIDVSGNCAVENNSVYVGQGNGIILRDGASARGNYLYNIDCQNLNDAGIWVATGSNFDVTNNVIDMDSCSTAGCMGIDVDSAAAHTDFAITGNRILNLGTTQGGIVVGNSSSTRGSVTGNTIESKTTGATFGSIIVDSSRTTVTGNVVRNAHTALDLNGTFNNVNGNHFHCAADDAWCVVLAAGSSYHCLVGNTLDGIDAGGTDSRGFVLNGNDNCIGSNMVIGFDTNFSGTSNDEGIGDAGAGTCDTTHNWWL